MTHQEQLNASGSLFAFFQKRWSGNKMAIDAFDAAKADRIDSLQRQLECAELLSFESFRKHCCDESVTESQTRA